MLVRTFTIVLLAALSAAPAWAQPAPDAEAAYTASIEKRAEAHTKPLNLDAEKDARVRKTIVEQYRALRDWHAANGPTVKDLKKKSGAEADTTKKAELQAELEKTEASLRTLHQGFLDKLSADLTPEQVDVIKDQMTYNVRNVTYKAFNEMLPELKDHEKAEIMKLLTEARELAMDGGSSDEKHAIFGKYKGRINNYLSKQGYDLKAASKAFTEKINAEKAAKKPATQPAAEVR
jgi:Spy/CpxP family protein refolding chaperone